MGTNSWSVATGGGGIARLSISSRLVFIIVTNQWHSLIMAMILVFVSSTSTISPSIASVGLACKVSLSSHSRSWSFSSNELCKLLIRTIKGSSLLSPVTSALASWTYFVATPLYPLRCAFSLVEIVGSHHLPVLAGYVHKFSRQETKEPQQFQRRTKSSPLLVLLMLGTKDSVFSTGNSAPHVGHHVTDVWIF